MDRRRVGLTLVLLLLADSANGQACGGMLTAPGTATSPNYPNDYNNDETCEWTINVPEGSLVLLTFDSFQTEIEEDTLSIYNGGSDSAPLLQIFSGNTIPEPVTGTTNQMFLRFTSDGSLTAQGFQFSYTATVDRCADGSHNCAPQETCYTRPSRNTADSFTCTVCQDPLGMQSGAIPDGSITASSTWSSSYAPYLARLHGRGGWRSNNPTIGEWLQVDLGEIKKVTGTITQGYPVVWMWLRSYKLQHSTDGASWTTYADGEGTEKVFIGNTDYYTPVTNLLDNAVEARYVRFLPQTWRRDMSMRAEILGCNIRVDECADGSNNCSPQATCSDTPESFTCTCNPGYIGNGVTCTACSTLYPGLKPSHNFGVYQNQCFWSGSFRTPRLNYMAAKQACQDEGGTLAMIKDEATQTFLRAHLRSTSGHRQRSYWIGLDDLNTEGTFLWNDETPLGDYDKFRSDAPNESRDCVTLWRSRRRARWDIKDCNTRRPYICQLSGSGGK